MGVATRNKRWEQVVSAVGVLHQARQSEPNRIKELTSAVRVNG